MQWQSRLAIAEWGSGEASRLGHVGHGEQLREQRTELAEVGDLERVVHLGDAAPRVGLRCYQGRGGLYELRLLDRPAIVGLHDGARVGYAVLTGMDDDTATLAINGQRHTVSLGLLATRIDGEYTTLWKVPRGFRDQVGPGDSGPDVDWIAARLAELDGKRAAPPAGQVLDEPTRRLLRAFQVKQNLKADGLAGPRTYMRLNQLTGVDEPRLLAATGK